MISQNTRTAEHFTISVTVTDEECINDLLRHEEGADRDQYASLALQLGAQFLRQSTSVIDHHKIREEGTRLVGQMQTEFEKGFRQAAEDIGNTLAKFLDPSDGALPLRLQRLIERDGELESILHRHLGDNESTLARTLDRQLGPESPFLRRLSTNPDEGFLRALNEVLTESLRAQTNRFKAELSLDDEQSALSRLVRQLTDENGRLRDGLAKDFESIQKEFCRDNPDGALSRLLHQVDEAHKAIVAEFSPDNEGSILSRITSLLEATNETIRASLTLDDEDSAMSRIKRELLGELKEMHKGQTEFQAGVRETLAAMKATREEAKRSTSHGNTFEENVNDFLRLEAQRLQDGFEFTGRTRGAINRNVGDQVITLGPESAAPGAKLVFESKGDKSYSLDKALGELDIAKQNREAQMGVFVFKRESAPENQEPLVRWGDDIVVLWDDEDDTTDVYLKAAYSVARCLAVKKKAETDSKAAEIECIEKAIQAITRKADLLDSINKAATKIRDKGDEIVNDSRKLKTEIEFQIEAIEEQLGRLL